MKKVFDNSMLAHVWAQQTQSEGRSASMRFADSTIYSYKTPIARIYDTPTGRALSAQAGAERKFVLITSRKYSVTTSGKHMPAVRSAVRNWRSIDVDNCTADSPAEHADNLADMVARYLAVREIEMRRRSAGDNLERLYAIERDARAYAEIFGLPQPTLNAQADDLCITEHRAAAQLKRETPAYLAKQAKALAAKEAREAKLRAELATEHAARLLNWRAGGHHIGMGGNMVDDRGGAYLRVFGDEVQTSQGARVPLSDAKRAIRHIRVVRASGRAWDGSFHAALAVGNFTVSEIRPNGDIVAGCHFIRFSEIDAVGKVLGV